MKSAFVCLLGFGNFLAFANASTEPASLRSASPSIHHGSLKTEQATIKREVKGEDDSFLAPINKKIPGQFSGRFQFLGIYRDYESVGYGHSSTLGAMLNYRSDRWEGFDFGAAYNYAGVVLDGGRSAITANGDIHVLNEIWLRYHFDVLGGEKTSLLGGRNIFNGEVFRKDDFRQKARAIESIQLQSEDIDGFRITLGHAVKMSNWIDTSDRWDFNDFGDVFGVGYDTDGVTWGEVLYTGMAKWEMSFFNAYAWDISNLMGARIQYDYCDEASLIFYYRHEQNVGRADTRRSDAYGVSYRQKIGGVTLEPGYFGVHGSGLLFQEGTTGINHPLGSSMMICTSQFAGGSDTAYIKATTKVGKTFLYALYNYTWHDSRDQKFDGQELNVIVKHPIVEHLTAGMKAGIGYRDEKSGNENVTFSDVRLFLTYTF
ncbi:MAG: hypothetical protein DSY82_01665 [Flavobacteriia bacterium]|nr:MAG: hypothetical protein DSY82_01665 [Flavobacteriia bacterium]